jgi:hypothetical protein
VTAFSKNPNDGRDGRQSLSTDKVIEVNVSKRGYSSIAGRGQDSQGSSKKGGGVHCKVPRKEWETQVATSAIFKLVCYLNPVG